MRGSWRRLVFELVPHVDEDDEGDVRARLSERIRMVSGFLRELCAAPTRT